MILIIVKELDMNIYIRSIMMMSAVSFSVAAKPVTVEHLMGKTTIEQSPERVVVIGIGALDAVNALGVEPVAVSKSTSLPEYLKQYEQDSYASAGTIFEPNFEAIYTQKPDLIIVGPRSSKHFEELSKIAPTYVFSIENGDEYWKSTQNLWRDLGTIFDKEALVDEKIKTYSQKIEQIAQYNQKNNYDALTLMSSGNNITTFGAGSRFSVIYNDFGFAPNMTVKKEEQQAKSKKSTRTGGHGQLVSFELIRENNPSTLFIVDKDKLVNKGKSTTHEDFENELVQSTDAYKNDRMVYLDVKAWYVASSGIDATNQMIKDIESMSQSE